jgi:hypothetical protein
MADLSIILDRIQDMVLRWPLGVTKLTVCQNPSDIDRILEGLHTRISTDVDVLNTVHFDLKRKTQQKEQTLSRVQAFQGPDSETEEVLRRNLHNWSSKPWMFWTSSEDGLDLGLDTDAQAQVVRSYVRAKGGDA